ncbi:MAG: type II toxin-antitoxin system VapC family toxin [Chloroflexota bacterium]|nr:type II toxin-antitoxin system VapC family toxin [Chloroflexota bacterium]
MSRAVLDASAMLALFRGERGADVVAGYRGDAVASAVNIAEVASRLSDEGLNPTEWHYALAMLELEVVAFDESQAFQSGQLRRSTRHRGLSLGDRACLQLAAIRGLPAVTADRAWVGLAVGVEVRVIRE